MSVLVGEGGGGGGVPKAVSAAGQAVSAPAVSGGSMKKSASDSQVSPGDSGSGVRRSSNPILGSVKQKVSHSYNWSQQDICTVFTNNNLLPILNKS